MQLKHRIGRGIFSLFGSLLLGAILAGGLGLMVGFVSFIGTVFVPPMSLGAAMIGAIVGGGLGFLYGGYHGFKIGNYIYQKYIEKNTAIVEPTFFSGRNDSITHSNELIRDINHLPASTITPRFLTTDEISRYREIITELDDRMARKKLNHYEDFIRDARNLSLSKNSNLHLHSPITIEHKKEPKSFAKTYEKDFIVNIIEKEKDNAKEPLKGYFLTSPNIRFYSGFPKWIQDFIDKVRSVLLTHISSIKPNKNIESEKEAKNETVSAPPKPLFKKPVKKKLADLDETIEHYNQKFGM